MEDPITEWLVNNILGKGITLRIGIEPGPESKLGEIMAAALATLEDLKKAVADLNTSVASEIAAVSAKIDAFGGSVSAAEAQALIADLTKIKSTLDAETASLTAPPTTGP